MKKCEKEKFELLAYAQDVNMYAESFSALYEEVEKRYKYGFGGSR